MSVTSYGMTSISSIVDIASSKWYYKLASSTPAKPTDNNDPPTGWSATEPSYTVGSTDSLYVVNKVIYGDGTFEFSDVSLYSSFSAAKNAAKTATNYLSYNSGTGLDVSYVGTNAKARVKGDGFEVFDGGGNSAAFFGVSNNVPVCRIGAEDSSNFRITKSDISATDSEGNIYWNVQDLRNETVEIVYEYRTYNGSSDPYYYLYKPYEITSLKVDGVEIVNDTSKYEIVLGHESWSDNKDWFLVFQADYEDSSPELFGGISSAYRPNDGAIITVIIKTREPAATFTFFSRDDNSSISIGSFSTGYEIGASGLFSQASGFRTVSSGNFSFSEGYKTTSSGEASHAEGYNTTASGLHSHAEGYNTVSSERYSHAEGWSCTASGRASHAEGEDTESLGFYSHAEGSGTLAQGDFSHAEGDGSQAIGGRAHAEGNDTVASGGSSHSEGAGTTAQGTCSHAEGSGTTASGNFSHAGGLRTVAASKYQTAIGRINIQDSSDTYALIIGNGTPGQTSSVYDVPSNALTVDWNGSLRAYGEYQDAAGATIFQRNKGNDSAHTEYPIFWNNQYILRLATKTTSTSSTGTAFILGNGMYAAGGSADGSIDITNTAVYLAGGCDATSRYITSPVAYLRTYNAAANMYVTVNGYIGRSTSSSIRYKHDISYITNSGLSVVNNEKKITDLKSKNDSMDSVLDIPIVTFKYNDGYVTGEQDFDYEKPIAGFIAEDVAAICPECATYIEDENGELIPESWDAKQFIIRMLYVLQKQQKEIETLKEKINE